MLARIVDHAAQVLGRDAVQQAGIQLDPIDLLDRGRGRTAAAEGKLAPGLGQLLLKIAPLGGERVDAGAELGDRDLELLGEGARGVGLVQQVAPGRFAGQGLDAPHAGGHAAFGDDLEQGDVAGAGHVGAAAKLDRIGAVAIQAVAQGQHPDFVTVFLAEQRHCAFSHGLLRRHQANVGGDVLAHHRVHLRLDPVELLVGERRAMGEVEADAFAVDHLALLGDVGAQDVAQGRMQQMGGGVVGAGPLAALGVDRQTDALALNQPALADLDDVGAEVAGALLHIEDAALAARPFDFALVAGLAAALGIEGGAVGQHLDGLAGFGRIDLFAARHQGQHLARAVDVVVAGEPGRPQPVAQGQPDGALGLLAGAGPGFARPRPLLGHGGLEALGVDGQALGAHCVLGEVQREAVGIVELEGDIAGQHPALAEPGGRFLEDDVAAAEGALEAFLLLAQGRLDHRLGADQFGIGGAHLVDQHRGQQMHQGLAGAQQMGVAHGAAHDPAQHISPALVGGRNAVRQQEAGGPQMIGDHPVGGRLAALGLRAGQRFGGGDQRAEEVRLIDALHALQHGGQPLQPHPGVDRRLGQGYARAAFGLVELHEDQVPDLHESVAVLFGRAGRAAGDGGAMVEEDLRAGAAGAGVAHGPEVVGGADPDDPLVGQAGDLLPEVPGLVVVGIDGDAQPVLGQAEIAGDQRPGELDRAFLEIVAEGEVPQHLEEGQVAGGVADVVQVVVLAAGAHALLRGGSPGRDGGLGAREDVLERHHAGVDEHQGRVALGHKWRGGRDPVIVVLEVAQEGGADFVQARHGRHIEARLASVHFSRRPDQLMRPIA